MDVKQKIMEASGSPEKLEALYHQDPEEFTRAFPEVFAEQPDSLILQVWHQRLSYPAEMARIQEEDIRESEQPNLGHRMSIGIIVILTIIAGTIVRFPYFFQLNSENYLVRNLPAIVLISLAAYFIIQKPPNKKRLIALALLAAAAVLYLNLLPSYWDSDTIKLALLHMPFFLWALLGVAYASGDWRSMDDRLAYLRYNGELLIYGTLLVISVGVFTGITAALFSLVYNEDAFFELYSRAVLPYILIAVPLVATYLIQIVIGSRVRIASLLAKIFAPLFLVMVVAYLLAMIVNQQSPFEDRDFLIVFNILLVLVLGISIFSILERSVSKKRLSMDYVNIGLVLVTLIIDIIALAAIFFRLASYGLTPNRLAVLGANMLFFINLALILFYYLRFLLGKGDFRSLEYAIVKYIPAYVIWVLFVAIGFPLIFHFQ